MFHRIITFWAYFIIFVFIYDICISLFSLIIRNDKTNNVTDKTSFSILIPCHNEENVIWTTLEYIYNSDYSKRLLKVYIIADNCTDKTVEIVNNFNKTHYLNCKILEVSGGSKPKALNSAVNMLKEKRMWKDDCIVVLDADNRVSETLFKSFNKLHIEGFKIVQCAIHSLNDTSFIAKGFTSSFNNMNRGFQYARNKIGLSGSLSGTGFSIDRDTWDEVDFNNCNTLTEDLEFSILAILRGLKIKFIYNDYVLNQHLDEFRPSFVQRVRWSRGHTQVFVKLALKTFVNFLKKPSIQLIDSLLFMFSPFKHVVYIIVLCWQIIFNHFAEVSIYLIIFPLIYYLVFFMICNNWKLKYFFPHIFYTITMFFAIVYGALTYRKKVWVKTFHKQIA